MTTAMLGDLCTVQIGRTPKRSESRYWGGEFPWVSISDLGDHRHLVDTKERITESGAKESNSKLIPAGTLMLSFKLSLGKRGFAGANLYTNEAIAGLLDLDIDRVDPVYLYWYLGVFDYDSMVDRAAMGRTLNKGKVQSIPVPLPPLPEQKRIAAILDAADALRAKRRESIDQLDKLVQSVFLDMFGDPVTNPKGWETPAIKEVAKTGSGTTPSRKREAEFYGGNIPWVKSGELRESVVTETEESVTEAALAETGLKLVPADALLIAMYGATVGRMGILGVPATTNQAICQLAFDQGRCRTEFVFHCLRLQVDQLVSMGKGGAQPNINQQIIKAFPLMLPPIEEQNRFVGAVGQVHKIRQAAESHLAELDTLFASLQSRAFRGEL